MSAASSLCFPSTFQDDSDFVAEALAVFLNQSGHCPATRFYQLTVLEQSVVLRMAHRLKEAREQ